MPPIRRGTALFLRAGSRPVRLPVGRVDHQLVGPASLRRQRGENRVEYAEPAQADEAVVDRLVRTIVLGHIAPAQAVLDDQDDPADQPWVIYPRHPPCDNEKRGSI